MAPHHVVAGVGQTVQGGHRHDDLFGEGAGSSTADAELCAELADVLQPLQAAAAPTSAEHGITGDPGAQPRGIHPVSDL